MEVSGSTKSNFTGSTAYHRQLKIYDRNLQWIKVLLILTPICILSQVLLSTVYKTRYESIRKIRAAYIGEGSGEIALLAGDHDSTQILISRDSGQTWTIFVAPRTIDISIDWKTGKAAGITLYDTEAVVVDSTLTTTTTTVDSAVSAFVWTSDDFGETRLFADELAYKSSDYPSIWMDWPNGGGRLSTSSNAVYLYTLDFGVNWKRRRVEGINEDTWMHKVYTVRLGEDSIPLVGKYTINPRFLIASAHDSIRQTLARNSYYTSADHGKKWIKHNPVVPKTPSANAKLFSYVAWIPLYALGVLLVLNMLLARKAKQAHDLSQSSLALMTDNPTTDDKLGFSPVVQSILKLLRNPDTRPPVTIALSGRWGSGKSSLMAQLQKELAGDKRFVTMWFNVWHFQAEDHMLASFLSSVLHTFERSFGIYFRLKLFWNKLNRLEFINKVMFYIGVLIVTPLMLYLLLNLKPFDRVLPALHQIPFANKILDSLGAIIETMGQIFSDKSDTKNNYGVFVLSVLTWIGGFLFLKKEWFQSGLSAFFQLIPLERFKMEAVAEDPGFREKYKKEFWEILAAAGDEKRYVVFVDDMDRISGARLKELMEGINFISDTASKPSDMQDAKASIFFVLGMDVQEVVKNLGRELSGGQGTAVEQAAYGASFMQKLIDLVVQVPGLQNCTPEQLKTIMIRENHESTTTTTTTTTTTIEVRA